MDAGNGSKAICRVSKVLRSPLPDPGRFALLTETIVSAMTKLILFSIFGLATSADAGSFVGLQTTEMTLTVGPNLFLRTGGTASIKPLRFTIEFGDTDWETGFRRLRSFRMKTGWKRFSLPAEVIAELGLCSFDRCGVYVGPSTSPSYYFIYFQRLGPKGEKQEVTVVFSKEKQGIHEIRDARR